MSPKHSIQRWNIIEEKNFIEGLGTHSDYGKDVGKERCLRGYIEAMTRFESADRSWNKLQRKAIMKKVEKEKHGI
jgi:hypothetical protein